MRTLSWKVVSTGKLDVGEKWSISICKADGEPFDSLRDAEKLGHKIEWLMASEEARFVTARYSELSPSNQEKIYNLMISLLALKEESK